MYIKLVYKNCCNTELRKYLNMASVDLSTDFPTQIKQTRTKIRDSFIRCHEALRERENAILSRVDQIEKEFDVKTKEIQELQESLDKVNHFSTDSLTSEKLKDAQQNIHTVIDNKLRELSADTHKKIEFKWDSIFESDIPQLGVIQLNEETSVSPVRTFPPQVKPIVPDYRAKQLPTAYSCKLSTDTNAPGELNIPRGLALHHTTGHIYIADKDNHRVQVFSRNGDYLFMFCERMTHPRGICITGNKVLVTQWSGHCVNMYELGGKLIRSVGTQGTGEGQFKKPWGLDVSERTNHVYVCEYNNKRVQVLTEDLSFHSMLGIGVFNGPLDVKVTRDRVLVLDSNDPCLFIFSSDHVIINRIITQGDGKQTNKPYFFDIDRDYNVIMSDYINDCVYIFNREGQEIHRIGKRGEGIGEFISPRGVALDNTGRVVVVCNKDTSCLQIF